MLDFQDRLSFIGPEEFIQTFAMKDPLENHKVGPLLFTGRGFGLLKLLIGRFHRPVSVDQTSQVLLPVTQSWFWSQSELALSCFSAVASII